MQNWFSSLEPRERAILLAGAAVAVIILGWAFLWNPLHSGAAGLSESVAGKHQLLASVRRAEATLAPTPTSTGTTTQSLVLLVDQTHREHGLAGTLSRNQPDGPDGIRVSFQGAPFDGLVDWLGALEINYGVAVETATFDGGQQTGLVTATLVLRRS